MSDDRGDLQYVMLVRGIPTEIPLGPDPLGLDEPCVASCDNLQPIRRVVPPRRGWAHSPRAACAEIRGARAAMADC